MSDRLRVVMVTTSYPRREGDFAGHFVASLAGAIVELGHSVSVVAPHDPGTLPAEEIGGVSVHRVRYAPDSLERLAYGDGIVSNIRRNPAVALSAPGLARALRRGVIECARGADVVHAHWAPTAALSRAVTAGPPLVVSLHGSDLALAQRGGVWRSLLKRGLSGAQAVNVMANAQRDLLLGSGLYAGPVEVIPSGIPAEFVDGTRFDRDDDEFRILFVGRLVQGKGVSDLIEAFARIARDLPKARLTIAGDGPLRWDLAATVVAQGVSGAVHFTGEVPHSAALELTASSDVLALPSYAEGSPLSVTEALAFGTPVIGTSVGALPELVAESGLLVAPGDVPALAAALFELAGDPARREAMGVAARERMRRDYVWPVIARRIVDLYGTAIELGGAGS